MVHNVGSRLHVLIECICLPLIAERCLDTASHSLYASAYSPFVVLQSSDSIHRHSEISLLSCRFHLPNQITSHVKHIPLLLSELLLWGTYTG